MAATRTIKGQPFISGDSLVQDQILLLTVDNKTVRSATGQFVYIENIWEDLKSTSGKWLSKIKKDSSGNITKAYFYWKVPVTDTSGDSGSDPIVEEMIECPAPQPEVFDGDFEVKDGDSDWTKYWKEKMASVEGSLYNSTNAVYRKEVLLPGTKYIKFGNALTTEQDYSFEEVPINEATVDMDDTMNLLTGIQDTGFNPGNLDDLNGLSLSL